MAMLDSNETTCTLGLQGHYWIRFDLQFVFGIMMRLTQYETILIGRKDASRLRNKAHDSETRIDSMIAKSTAITNVIPGRLDELQKHSSSLLIHLQTLENLYNRVDKGRIRCAILLYSCRQSLMDSACNECSQYFVPQDLI